MAVCMYTGQRPTSQYYTGPLYSAYDPGQNPNSAFVQNSVERQHGVKIPDDIDHPFYGKRLTKSLDFSTTKLTFVNSLFLPNPIKMEC